MRRWGMSSAPPSYRERPRTILHEVSLYDVSTTPLLPPLSARRRFPAHGVSVKAFCLSGGPPPPPQTCGWASIVAPLPHRRLKDRPPAALVEC